MYRSTQKELREKKTMHGSNNNFGNPSFQPYGSYNNNFDANGIMSMIMSMSLFKELQSGHSNNHQNDNQNNTYGNETFLGCLLMNLRYVFLMILFSFAKEIPGIVQYIVSFVQKEFVKKQKEYRDYLQQKLENTLVATNNNSFMTTNATNLTTANTLSVVTSSILFRYSDGLSNLRLQAVLYHLERCDNSKSIMYIGEDIMIRNKQEIQLSPFIFARIQNEGNNIEKKEDIQFDLEVFSRGLGLLDLNKYIDDLVKKHEIAKNNKLGDDVFFFQQMEDELRNRAFDTLLFKMTRFATNKSLSNTFGNHIRRVRDRVHLFETRQDWYVKKGIPHTLGILVHGPPGTGKTSLIKAIAKDTKRHVVSLKLNEDTTENQVDNLFHGTQIEVINSEIQRAETLQIPNEKRLYVIEDIDALGPVVLRRDLREQYYFENESTDDDKYNNNKNNNHNNHNHNNNNYNNHNNNNHNHKKGPKISLGYILNLLDGILEVPGRVIIISTNHPEKLDPALIRPGRIDINLRVDACDIEMIQELFDHFFEELLDRSQNIDDNNNNNKDNKKDNKKAFQFQEAIDVFVREKEQLEEEYCIDKDHPFEVIETFTDDNCLTETKNVQDRTNDDNTLDNNFDNTFDNNFDNKDNDTKDNKKDMNKLIESCKNNIDDNKDDNNKDDNQEKVSGTDIDNNENVENTDHVGISPAEVMCVLQNHFDCPKTAFDELKTLILANPFYVFPSNKK